MSRMGGLRCGVRTRRHASDRMAPLRASAGKAASAAASPNQSTKHPSKTNVATTIPDFARHITYTFSNVIQTPRAHTHEMMRMSRDGRETTTRKSQQRTRGPGAFGANKHKLLAKPSGTSLIPEPIPPSRAQGNNTALSAHHHRMRALADDGAL